MYTVKYGNRYIHNPVHRPGEPEYHAYDLNFDLVNDSDNYCDFTIYSDHPLYNVLKARDSGNPVTAWSDSHQLFSGFIDSITKEMYNNLKISCKEDKAYLKDSIIAPFTYEEITLGEFVSKVIAEHNRQVGGNKTFSIGSISMSSTQINVHSSDYKTAYDVFKEDILGNPKLHDLQLTVGFNRAITLRTVPPVNNTQVIDFGVNLLDYTVTDAYDEIATYIIPTGANIENEETGESSPLTIEDYPDGSVGVGDIIKSGNYIYSPSAASEYGVIYYNHSNSNINNVNILVAEAANVLIDLAQSNKTIEAKAIDLSLLNPNLGPIMVGEKMRIRSAPHGVDDLYLCTSINLDLNNPENSTYIFGKKPYSFTNFYEDDRKNSDSKLNDLYDSAENTHQISVGVNVRIEPEDEPEPTYEENSITLSKTTAAYNDLIEITNVTPKKGYTYSGGSGSYIYRYEDQGVPVTEYRTFQLSAEDREFYMPNSDVQLNVSFDKNPFDIVIELRVKTGDDTYDVIQPGPDAPQFIIAPNLAWVEDQVPIQAFSTPQYKCTAVEVVEYPDLPTIEEPKKVSLNQDSIYWFEMPGERVMIIGWYEAATYNIKFDDMVGGTATAQYSGTDVETAKYMQTITVHDTPAVGYSTGVISAVDASGGVVQVDPNKQFSMPASDVTISVSFTGNQYSINYVAPDSTIGTLTGPGTATVGSTVTVAVHITDETYEVDHLDITCQGTQVSPLEYSFIMPAGNVTVAVIFKKKHRITEATREIDTSTGVGTVTIQYADNHTYVMTATVTIDSTTNTKTLTDVTETYDGNEVI